MMNTVNLSTDALKKQIEELQKQLAACQADLKQAEEIEFDEAVKEFLKKYGVFSKAKLKELEDRLDGIVPQVAAEPVVEEKPVAPVKVKAPIRVEEPVVEEKEEEFNFDVFDIDSDEEKEVPAEEKPVEPVEEKPAFTEDFFNDEEDSEIIDAAPSNKDLPLSIDESPIGTAEPLGAAKEEAKEDDDDDYSWDIFSDSDDMVTEAKEDATEHIEEIEKEDVAKFEEEEEKRDLVKAAEVEEPKQEEAEEDDFDFDVDDDDDFDIKDDEEDSAVAIKKEDIAGLVAKAAAAPTEEPKLVKFKAKDANVKAEKALLKAILTAGADNRMSVKEAADHFFGSEEILECKLSRDIADEMIDRIDDLFDSEEESTANLYEDFAAFPDFVQQKAVFIASRDIYAIA